MEHGKHLLYYWKDFDKNLKSKKVGWLGTKGPAKKKFTEFNVSLGESDDSWIIAFRWEKSTNKTFPLAVLSVVKDSVVTIDSDKDYDDFIYFDPKRSFRLNRPTESGRLSNFHKLGSEIVRHFDKSAISAGFFGSNGVQSIFDEDIKPLLANAEKFRGNELSIYVDNNSWLNAPSPAPKETDSSDADEPQPEDENSASDIDPSSADADLANQDWAANGTTPEEANRRREKQAENGRLGEELAMRFEMQRLRDLACANPENFIKHIAKSNTDAGFDILSEWNGEIRFIEVKASENGSKGFFISENEVTQLTRFGCNGWLYFVNLAERDTPDFGVMPLRDPGGKFEKRTNQSSIQDPDGGVGIKIVLRPTQYRARLID